MSLSVANSYDPIFYSDEGEHIRENRAYVNTFRTTIGGQGVLNFQSSGTIVFQISPLDNVSNMVLQVDGLVGPAVGQNIPQAWLFAGINNIKITVGSSDVYVMNSAQLLMNAMRNCENQQKKEKILQLAGAQLLSGTGGTHSALIPLNFLWSSFNAYNKKKPMPFSELAQGATITVQLQPICYGASASTYTGVFTNARMFVETVVLKGEGLKMAPNSVYHYNCSLQGFQQTVFQGDNTNGVTLPIQGFYNGRLKALHFCVIDQTTSGENFTTKPVRISDVSISQNGNKILDLPGFSLELFDLGMYPAPLSFTTDAVERYIYTFPIAELDAMNKNLEEQGVSLASQYLSIQFKTPNGSGTQYQLIMVMDYSGALLINNKTVSLSYSS
jgi:hypothetical protein